MSDEERPPINEETPLLESEPETSVPEKATPLPKLQCFCLMLQMFAEPITFSSISPYLNRLIAGLDVTGGNPKRVGYYAGLLLTLFFATEACTTYQWSRLSDRIGRKPVFLIGLFGLTISMTLFGLSRTYITLVLSRSLSGLLNGNAGVMKTVLSEITDDSNRALAFSLMPVTFSIGAAFGPLLGGTLEHPREKYPKAFPAQFWSDYPYFLPSLIAACFCLFSALVTLFFFKETNPAKVAVKDGKSLDERTSKSDFTFRSVLTYPMIISVGNYVLLAFVEMVILAILPIFYASAIENGGIGCSPDTIGRIFGVWGIINGVFQVIVFAPLVKRFGPKKIFVTCFCGYVPVYLMFPIMNLTARSTGGVTAVVWAMIVFQFTLMVFADLTFGSIFMFVVSSCAPSKVAATNGVSQTAASIVRMLAPSIGASLYSLSAEYNLLGGYMVYYVGAIFATGSIVLAATRLPAKPWKFTDD